MICMYVVCAAWAYCLLTHSSARGCSELNKILYWKEHIRLQFSHGQNQFRLISDLVWIHQQSSVAKALWSYGGAVLNQDASAIAAIRNSLHIWYTFNSTWHRIIRIQFLFSFMKYLMSTDLILVFLNKYNYLQIFQETKTDWMIRYLYLSTRCKKNKTTDWKKDFR